MSDVSGDFLERLFQQGVWEEGRRLSCPLMGPGQSLGVGQAAKFLEAPSIYYVSLTRYDPADLQIFNIYYLKTLN